MLARLILITFFLLNLGFLYAQQNPDSIIQLPEKYIETVSKKFSYLEQRLDHSSDKAVKRMMKLEERMKKKLSKIDSIKANEIFGNAKQKYQSLQQQIKNKVTLKQYIPSLDTMSVSLKFIEQNGQLVQQVKDGKEKLEKAITNVNGLDDQFQAAEKIKSFLKERKQFLKEQLDKIAFAKELKKLNKEVYYYSQQINEYKSLLSDYKKAERKALELLSKTKLFKDFIRNNSQLAALFHLPADPNDPLAQANLAGLQTRTQVSGLVQQQLSAGGSAARAQFQQNLQNAQNQLNQLKDKISSLGGNSSEDILPENFRPNNQKTKSFLQRLEYGTNFQSQKPNGYFPVTSDIGLSLGYKLNDKSIMGIGASYKIGWGQNIRRIDITSQGVGLRSFVDWKIKESFWLSGGYEMNYRNEFNRIDRLRNVNAWQQSGLLGVSKVISLKTKFFKKTKLQLLWDFLSYEQVPRTPAIIFRVGYSIK